MGLGLSSTFTVHSLFLQAQAWSMEAGHLFSVLIDVCYESFKGLESCLWGLLCHPSLLPSPDWCFEFV